MLFATLAVGATGKAATIPERMAPNTIIEYTGPTTYTIIQGGVYIPSVDDIVRTASAQTAVVQDYVECFGLAAELRDLTNVITIEPEVPVAGTRVIYKNNGYIRFIQQPNEVLPIDTGILQSYANGTYPYGRAQVLSL